MKRKKYLACCVAASMMLGVASPAMVCATVQDDFSVSEVADVEGVDDMATSDTEGNEEITFLEDEDMAGTSVDVDTQEDYESKDISDQDIAADVEMFSSGEEFATDAVDSDANEGWTPLTEVGKEDRILYKYDEDTKTLYFKCSSSENVAMPNYTYGHRTDWFLNLGEDKIAQIEKIVIGDGITEIGEYCFESNPNGGPYSSLKEVVLPETVTKISRAAFYKDTSLTTINLNNVLTVDQTAFAESGIENVLFEAPEVSIGMNAFKACTSLQSVIANNISSIGESAFEGCSSLQSVKAKKIITVGKSTFKKCTALKTFIYEGGLSEIPQTMFSGSAIESFNFDSVTTIGKQAFNNTSLKTGCYSGTREEWNALLQQRKTCIPDTAIIHCKGEAVEAKAATCTEDGWNEVGVCEVCGEHYSYPTDENVIPATGHTWSEDYVVDKEATCTEAGEKSKHCTVCGVKNEEDVQKIPATGHKFSDWKVTSEATVFAAEKQERTCATCGAKETRTNGTVLEPTVSVNASNVKLKVKQSTTGLKVTGLAKGDSVKSWKSTNPKIFTVKGKANGTCKLTAKKAGTAKLQITLVSGKQQTIKVKVQKSAVKTTKLTVANKKVTLQKGKKTTLKAVVTPFTSGQKVTYTSSNKKIATVSSKGVVTGKKKGTVKITVKSGSKSVKVTVRVK